MTGGHQFAEQFNLALLQRFYGLGCTRYFSHYVARTFLGDWISNSILYLFPIFRRQFSEELNRLYFADLLNGCLALTNAVVVCTAVEVVRAVRIRDDYFDAL